MSGTGGQQANPVYHRLRSSTQTTTHDQMQVRSQQVCGKAGWGSHIPSVKAYPGPLPASASGIEFTTGVAPSPGRSSPSMTKWYQGDPGVVNSGAGMVCIAVTIMKVVP